MGSRGQLGVMMDKIEDMMERIVSLSNKVDDLTAVVHHINNTFILSSPQDWSANQITKIKDELSASFSNDLVRKMTPVNVDWSKKLQQRKFCFYEALRNESLADIYESALQNTIPKIPVSYTHLTLPTILLV